MFLMALFALLALVLASVGIYGVIAYSVSQRTHEIGIRLVLGAQHSRILSLVLRQGMGLAVLGITLGMAGALALTRYPESYLFEVAPTDSITFASVALLLAATAFLACLISARRAMKVDPMVALRYE